MGAFTILDIYNEICNASYNFSYVLFADDTNLLLKDTALDQLYSYIKVKTELLKISKWVIANKLSVIIRKTNFILFQNHFVANTFGSVYLEGYEIQNQSY